MLAVETTLEPQLSLQMNLVDKRGLQSLYTLYHEFETTSKVLQSLYTLYNEFETIEDQD